MLAIGFVAFLQGVALAGCSEPVDGPTFHLRMVMEPSEETQYYPGLAGRDGVWAGDVVVADSHFEELSYSRTDAGLYLDIVLSREGMRRLYATTKDNIGHSIAAIVGRCVVLVVPITGPTAGSSPYLSVSLDLAAADVTFVEALLRKRWAPEGASEGG